MKQRWSGTLGMVVVWFGVAGTALAADVSLTISIPSPLAEGGTASTQLRMGLVPGATSGFDTRWDVPAPPAPSGNVVTLSAGIQPPSVSNQQLLWDFREVALPQSWTINVTTDQPDSVTLAWTTTGSGNACAPLTWSLEDLYSGARVDLDATAPGKYDYSGPTPRTRAFVIRADAAPTQPQPSSPVNLWSPRQGRSSVYLAWSPSSGSSVRYHVYRENDQGKARLTLLPIAGTAYVDTGIDFTKPVTYYVTAVASTGCESPQSNAYRLTPRR